MEQKKKQIDEYSIITDEGSKPEIHRQQPKAQTTAAFGMTGVFLSVPRYD